MALFGTEITIWTFVVLVAQLMIFSHLFIHLTLHPKNITTRRFLILTSFYIAYSLARGFFPDEDLMIPLVVQRICMYITGIGVAVAFFVYISNEFNFAFSGIFSVKTLLISLIASVIISYVIGYISSDGDHETAHYTFILNVILIAAVYLFMTIKQLRTKSVNSEDAKHYRSMYKACLIGVIFIFMLPVESLLLVSSGIGASSSGQVIEITTVNVAYVLLIIANVKRYRYTKRKLQMSFSEEISLEELKQKELLRSKLTPKQFDIALYIIQSNLKFSEISEIMYITPNTVSKHASNIYREFEINSRNELIKLFDAIKPIKKTEI